MPTIHEALIRDRDLDIEGRQHLYDQARELIHVEVDRVMAASSIDFEEAGQEALELASDPYSTEFA